MTDAEQRLLTLRREALVSLARLDAEHEAVVAASRDSNADDEHDPEGSTIAFERAQVDALARAAHARLGDIDRALDRLAAGTYGVCERCGTGIAPGRLEVRPTATTCVDCASR